VNPQALGDFSAPGMLGPVKGSPLVMNILDVESGSSFDKQADDIRVAGQGGLVQGRRV